MSEISLVIAVINEDVKCIRRLIDSGESVNYVNEDNQSLLHLIANNIKGEKKCEIQRQIDRKKVVYMLTDAGVDLELRDKNNQTCLELAVNNFDSSLCEVFLQCGADMFQTTKDGVSIFDRLLDLEQMFEEEKLYDTVKVFKKYEPGIWNAVSCNCITKVRCLINLWCKTDLEKNGRTLQETAIDTGNEEIIGLILGIHSTMKLVLHVLASDTRKVKLLLETSRNNLRLDLRNMSHNGAPILYYVLKQNDAAMVDLFVKHGCQIYTVMRDSNGQDMPVFFSTLKPDTSVDIMEALLPQNKHLQEDLLSTLLYKGKSVLEIAIEENVSPEIFNLLLDRGGAKLVSKRNIFNETAQDLALKLNKPVYVNIIDKNIHGWIFECEKYPNQRQTLALHGYGPLLDVDQYEDINEHTKEFMKELPNYQDQIKYLAEAVERGDISLFNDLCIYPNNELFSCCLSWEGRPLGDYLPLLHRAVLYNKPLLVKAILKQKLTQQSIDTLFDQHNRTALHYAYAMPDMNEIRKYLLESGCSEHVLDKNGKEPLDFKDKAGSPLMIELLNRLKNKNYGTVEPDPWQSSEEFYINKEKASEYNDHICDFISNHYNFNSVYQEEFDDRLEENTKYCIIL